MMEDSGSSEPGEEAGGSSGEPPVSSGETLTQRLHRLKKEYITSTETIGGTSRKFREVIEKDFDENEALYEKHLDQMLKAKIAAVWESDSGKPEDERQQRLFDLDEYLTVNDKTDPSKYRKVATTQAVVRQVREQATITLLKGSQTSTAGAKLMGVYNSLIKRGADPEEKLSTFAERTAKKPAKK